MSTTEADTGTVVEEIKDIVEDDELPEKDEHVKFSESFTVFAPQALMQRLETYVRMDALGKDDLEE